MKITIDLEDLVNEFVENADCGEYGIEDQFNLKDEIKHAITSQVAYKNFSKEIEGMRSTAHSILKQLISDKIEGILETQIERIIKNDKFKYNGSNTELTLSDYIKKVYEDTSYNRKLKLEEITKDIANERAEEMKERYDMLFTSQLVSKLDQMGLLREDAAKILLQK